MNSKTVFKHIFKTTYENSSFFYFKLKIVTHPPWNAVDGRISKLGAVRVYVDDNRKNESIERRVSGRRSRRHADWSKTISIRKPRRYYVVGNFRLPSAGFARPERHGDPPFPPSVDVRRWTWNLRGKNQTNAAGEGERKKTNKKNVKNPYLADGDGCAPTNNKP